MVVVVVVVLASRTALRRSCDFDRVGEGTSSTLNVDHLAEPQSSSYYFVQPTAAQP